ncbi:MAG: acetylglutamate kinase [Clostridia bacterium]|nr:acetylglutamate kinase [Clostridia bacterium]
MEFSNSDRAQVLVQALPYIKKYTGKVCVIKYGGNAMINETLKQAVMRDMVLLNLVGVKVVLVHGGGPEISSMLTKIGKKSEFVNGLRVTDEETIDIVQMVLAGKVNKDLVALINQAGGNAIGLSGIDGKMIQATCKDKALGYVGEIKYIDPQPIHDVLDRGYIPVISTVGCDNECNAYNVNADTAAAKIAAALNAETLISMSDIPGLLRDVNNPDSLIPSVDIKEVPALIESGVISGGMIPKVECCTDALKDGVGRVFIIDGRVEHSIIIEMLTDEGIGTMFTNKKGVRNKYTFFSD